MPDRLPRIVTREQAAAMLAIPSIKSPTGLRQRVVLETLYRAGLRAAEVTGLKAEDVHIKDLRLDIRGSKRAQSRAVPVGDKLAGWLQSWSGVRPQQSEWFFCAFRSKDGGGPGNRLQENWLRTMVKSVARRAAEKNPTLELDPAHVSPHVYRHTFATELMDEGFAIPEIQILLGHRNIRTTAIYLHVKLSELAEKVKARDAERDVLAEDVAETLKGLDRDQLHAVKDVLGML